MITHIFFFIFIMFLISSLILTSPKLVDSLTKYLCTYLTKGILCFSWISQIDWYFDISKLKCSRIFESTFSICRVRKSFASHFSTVLMFPLCCNRSWSHSDVLMHLGWCSSTIHFTYNCLCISLYSSGRSMVLQLYDSHGLPHLPVFSLQYWSSAHSSWILHSCFGSFGHSTVKTCQNDSTKLC